MLYCAAMALAGMLLLAPAKPPVAEPARVQTEPCRAPFLFETKNKILQRNFERALSAGGYDRFLGRKALAVAVVDLTQDGRTYYAGVNDDDMMYAASLPKIAILLAVVQAVNEGRLTWTHEFDTRLQTMITASDNADASWGADLVGLLGVENTVRDPGYCFYDDVHGGLWVGRAYRGGGVVRPDPLKGLSHGATARQAVRFFTLLDAGLLVSDHWSFRMLGLMSPPMHHHKFVAGIGTRLGVVFLARKSGTWHNFHSDSALVQHDSQRYAMVAISEHPKGEEWMRDIAQRIDDLMMEGAHRKKAPSRRQVQR